MSRVLIIGGPGNISTSTIRFLLDRRETVGIFTLPGSPREGLEREAGFYFGDRNEPGRLPEAVEQFRPDIAIDYSCFTEEQASYTAGILSGRLKQYIFVSTCDVYGYPLPQLPMTEEGPFNKPVGEYAVQKRKCEEIFTACGKDRLPLTIVRPSYSMGRDFAITSFSRDSVKYFVNRLRNRQPVLSPGDGTTLFHPSAAYNTGRMIACIAGAGKTIGESFTCGHDTFMTHDGYIHVFAKVLGVEPHIVHIPTDLIYLWGGGSLENCLLNALTRHNVAFSMEKFKKYFPGFKWEMSIEDAVRLYIEWNDRTGLFDAALEEIFEDRLIKTYLKCTGKTGIA